MPRSKSLSRLLALAALIALAPVGADAQDVPTIIKDANGKRDAIQKKLAETADKADWSRLRIDSFEEANGVVKVNGVFLDSGARPGEDVWSPLFGKIKPELEELILVTSGHKKGDAQFDWATGIKRVGGVDKEGKLGNNPEAPHVLLQKAANKVGQEAASKGETSPADRLVAVSSRFGAQGNLILSVIRGAGDAEVAKWLDDAVKTLLEKHPAANFMGRPVAVSWEPAKDTANLKWSVSAKAIQAALATGEEKAFRRLFVSRAYCAPPTDPDPAAGWERMEFRVEGFRSGGADLLKVADPNEIEPKVRAQVAPVWTAMTKGTPAAAFQVNIADLLRPLNEPVAELQLAVSANRALDGVRIDPGFTFDETGKLLLAGLQPELTKPAQAELETTIRKALAAFSTDKRHNETTAAKYKVLSAQPVSAAEMQALPIGQVRKDLHDWAVRTKDDVRLRRLFFVPDPKALEPQFYTVAKDGGGLVLVYQATSPADIKAVDSEFTKIFAKHFPKGLPASKLPAAEAPKTSFEKDPLEGKEPLLPGLTAELRRRMTADQKTWDGVLIERGYFDDQDRYTLAGVVDRKEQNSELLKLLTQLKGEDKWKRYFRDADGLEQPVKVPDLAVISMSEMLARVQRVMPAYSDFDGVRVESAFYDPDLYLTFKAHAVGRVTPDVVGKLADLLVRDPKYTRRVIKPEPPADKPGLRLPPKVRIMQVAGPAYADDQVANFSLAYGAKLLSKAHVSKEDRAKAREWLDVAMLHYPNESAVWFLDAYYNFTDKGLSEADRTELVKRDLYRTIEVEGPLAFNGPAQRKRRYEAAKDFQGESRNELEALWLEYFREVRDGARPITLTGK